MDNNLIITLIGLAVTIIAGVGGLIISIFTKIARLEARLDTLANDNRLQDKVDKIHDESIRKLQQRATELHEQSVQQLRSTLKAETARLTAVLVQQQLAQIRQEIEQEKKALRQEKMSSWPPAGFKFKK